MIYELILVEDKDLIETFKNFSNKDCDKPENYLDFLCKNFIKKDDKDKLKIFGGNDFFDLFTLRPHINDYDLTKNQEYEKFEKEIIDVDSKLPFKSVINKFYSDKIYKQYSYATHYILFFKDILFAIKPRKDNDTANSVFIYEDDENNFDEYCKKEKEYEIFTRNENYKVLISKKTFAVYNGYNKNFFDTSISKVLLIQTLLLSYEEQCKNYKNILSQDFKNINIDKILEIKKSFFEYKQLSKVEVTQDRIEAKKIFELSRKVLKTDEIFKKISDTINEFFDITNQEFQIENIKLQRHFNQNIEKILKEQELANKEREERNKKMALVTYIAAFITILTFISVIADVLNLWDRFFK